ncbi:MAG: cytochrome c biogenesis protein CcsA [Candidatus Margulisiibacteriota bacterium]
MKRILFALFIFLFSIKLMHIPSQFDFSVGRLPVLHDGRVKPIDSLARHELLLIQGRLGLPDKSSPTSWYFNMLTRPGYSASDSIILVEHPKLFDSIDRRYLKQKYRISEIFLDDNLELVFPFIQSASKLDKEERTPIQQASYILSQRYSMVKDIRQQFFPYYDKSQLAFWNEMIALSQSLNDKNPQDSPEFIRFLEFYDELVNYNSTLLFVFDDQWRTLTETALDPMQQQRNILSNYLLLSDSFQKSDLNNVKFYSYKLLQSFKAFSLSDYLIVHLEYFFNIINPFIVSLFIYFLIVLMVFFARFFNFASFPTLIKDAWLISLIFHTFGLVARSIILARPPVINLYSSAIFIAYVVSLIGYAMYAKNRQLFYAGYTSVLSLLTLIVAYHLSLSGDTLVVMQAVLNSNFWLSTHVVSMTIGYAIILMAGFFAISYILMGTMTRLLTSDFENRLSKLVYIFLMISLFFNFLGTVLGGIWADQSWGRFWGWDPKENGAIMIVLWIAIILHMKWGKLLSNRWLMILTVFSNIVTVWSWKGTNMLGIGLHSYGFTEKTFYWLMIFFVTQIAIMVLAMIPKHLWLSFSNNDN